MRLLLIEDDHQIATLLLKFLKNSGYAVDWANTGQAGLNLVNNEDYDLIITDYLLPDINGDLIIDYLRAHYYEQPILAISVRQETQDKVTLLNRGADDYLIKPFDLKELRARIESLTRRQIPETINNYIFDDLELNIKTQELNKQGELIPLTAKEFQLLKLFMEHPDEALSREQIHEYAWGEEMNHKSNIVDTYIRKLRKKINSKKPPLIETVPEIGYRWRQGNSTDN